MVEGRFRFIDDTPRPGGFSHVFKAYDLDSDPLQVVAVKVLRVGSHPDQVGNAVVAREFESLERLTHENIVRLVDAGIDTETGERYLVLEWVDSNLDSYLDSGPPEPDFFIGNIGLKVTAALAYAHSHDVAHRDLKPSNVLIAADGAVKLADFGISKILDALQPEDPMVPKPTLAHFMTPPYSPPENNLGALARDVWGIGATLLAGVTRTQLKDYDHLELMKATVDATSRLGRLLLDCLAADPSTRPKDGRVVHTRLQSIWRERVGEIVERKAIYLTVTRTAAEMMDHTDLQKAALLVSTDLADSPAIASAPNKQGDSRHFKLYGDSWVYRVTFEMVGRAAPHVTVIAAYPPSSGEIERARDLHVLLETFEFTSSAPADWDIARSAIEQLIDEVERFEIEARERTRLDEAGRVLDQWRRQIDARTRIEQQRERPVSYSRVDREGRRARFRIKGSDAQVTVGEIRRAVGDSGVRVFVRGQIEEADSESVVIYLDEGVEGIPARGKLIVDTQPSRIKIQRERAAIDIVAHDPNKAARPDIADLLFNPHRCAPPQPVTVENWVSTGLDDSKRRAVEAALGSKDLFLVQGPPGTGKTTFIAELVVQELTRNPLARILIASQTNVALDNALDRIDRLGIAGRIVRLADPKFGRVSADAERFRVEGQLMSWRQEVKARSDAFLGAWVEGRGVSLTVVDRSRSLREWADVIDRQRSVEDDLKRLETTLDNLSKGTARETKDVTEDELNELIQDALDRSVEADQGAKRFERSNAQLVKAYSSEHPEGPTPSNLRRTADECLGGSDAAKELRTLVSLQADWIQRLGRGEGFIAALAQGSAVIGATCIGLAAVQELADAQFDLCIIDECSKATATETLVPMVRSRRWVLVGDERQLPPMVEDALKDRELVEHFEIDLTELQQTLFGRLAQGLPLESQLMLTEQHRMVPAIGNMISSCFYDDLLKSVGPPDPTPIPRVFPKPVVWYDTTSIADRHERRPAANTFSFVNTAEAGVARSLIATLNQHFAKVGGRPSVLVLAPYAAQVTELRRRVNQLGDLPNLSVEVTTVDAVQGREADYVIFSVTRSNETRDPGFLRLEARANVALSRARQGLAIVGDLSFCRSTETPFRDVAAYIASHSDTCARERGVS